MKLKQLYKLLLFPIVLLTCAGCFNNKLPYIESLVTLSYKDGFAVVTNEKNIDVSNFKMYDFDDNRKEIKRLFAGDILKVYYTSPSYEQIDHILVKRVDVMETYLVVGFNDQYNLQKKNDTSFKFHFAYIDANYFVVNENSSVLQLKSAPWFPSILYCVYHQNENVVQEFGYTTIYPYGIYTFEPNWF